MKQPKSTRRTLMSVTLEVAPEDPARRNESGPHLVDAGRHHAV
jgi:hypothetical protein